MKQCNKKNIILVFILTFMSFEGEMIASDKKRNDPNSNDSSNAEQKLESYRSIWQNGLKAKEKLKRQKAVDELVQGLAENRLKGTIAKCLLDFHTSDYSEQSKGILSHRLKNMPEYNTILLVGLADIASEKDRLGKIIDKVEEPINPFDKTMKRQKNTSHSLAFAALMARARMGDKNDIDKCIQLVESCSDEEFKVTVLFERISYIRQPKVVEYLKAYLFSDKEEPGEVTIKLTYGQRAAMALSNMLSGFPGNKEYGGNKKTIEECRKWMTDKNNWEDKIIR